jgi:hypothetical protein
MKRAWVLLLFSLVVTAAWAAEWGVLEPGPYPGPASPGPKHSSKLYVVRAVVENGQAEVVLPLTQPKGALAVVLGDRPQGAAVRGKALPRREFFEPELSAMDLSPEGVRFDLSALAPGEQRLVLSGLAKPEVQIAVAEPESPLALSLQVTPLAARSGEPVVVTAELADERAVRRAQVLARLSNGKQLLLRDDGEPPDARAGDGVFTGAFTAPEVAGFAPVELRVEAGGQRWDGTPFARVATAAVMVTKPASGVAPEGVQVAPEALAVPLLPASGRFRVEVLYAAGQTAFAYAQEEVQLAGEAAAVSVPRPRETWGADKALVRLLNLDTLGVEAELEVPLTPLGPAPDFRVLGQKAQPLPASKAEAARRFGDPR